MTAQATVDVVVVTYKPGRTITDFLASIAGDAAVASCTVVDNDSGDAVAEEAATSAGAQFVAMGRNAGYGAASNAGAAQGTAPWILVSNPDIEVEPGALEALVGAGAADPRIGAVGPTVLETDGTVYPSARPLPTLGLGVGHALLGRVWRGNPWTRRYRADLSAAAAPREAGWLSGSCFLVRREAWEQVGGFDEGFFMFFEDVDLGRRLGLAGWRQVWIPAARVTHLGGHSYRSDPAPMVRAHHDSAARYVGLAYPRWWQAPVRAAVTAGLRMRASAEVNAARRTRAD